MKTKLLASVLCAAVILLFVESRREIAQLRSELRTYSFEYAEPHVEVVVLKKEVLPAKEESDLPTIRLTGVVRQIGAFPLVEYRVGFGFKAKVSEHRIETLIANADIKDRTGAFTADSRIYGVSKEPIVDSDSLKVELTSFGWGKMDNWKSLATLREQTP